MGFYGDELFDVLAAFGNGDGATSVRIEPGALEEAINRRRASVNLVTRGMTVLFRRARYIIQSRESGTPQAPWLADLVLPKDITAWFAPGAVLAPDEGVIIDIEGPIVANADRIFDEVGGDGGMIVLGGDLDAVLPEWWGVGKDLDDADALQRAIDAATIRRRPIVNRDGEELFQQPRRPLPVLLRQRYEVRRPLWSGLSRRMARSSANKSPVRFADATDPVGPFGPRLIGIRSGSLRSSAVLAARNGFAAIDDDPAALLVMLNSVGAEVSNVAFAANQRAAYGAIVTLTRSQPHSIAFEDCVFDGATDAQLYLGPPQQVLTDVGFVVRTRPDSSGVLTPVSDTPVTIRQAVAVEEQLGPDPAGSFDLSALRVQRCAFRVDASTSARGIVLRASNTLPLHVQRCTFSGTASAMVHVIAGSALLDGCFFDNRAPTTLFPPAPRITAGGISVIATGFEAPNGVDVFLSADVLTVGPGWRPQSTPNEGVTELVPRSAVELASFCTAFACTSHSGRFLGTIRPTTVFDSRPDRNTLVYAVDHCPTRDDGAPPDAAGVSWGWHRVSASGGAVPAFLERGLAMNASNTRLQMSYDPACCVVASQFPTGFEIFYGAAQSVVFGAGLGVTATPLVRFREVIRGVRMPTAVFGRGSVLAEFFFAAMMLLTLIGCDRTSSTPADASVSSDTVDAPKVAADIALATLDVIGDRVPPDIAASDVAADLPVDASLTDAYDASSDSSNDASDTGGVLLTDLGPAQQMRAACPEPTDGDPTIPVPRLVFPLSPMRATSRRPTLIWELAPGLTGARIEICRDRCCRTVIATLDATGTSVRPTEMLPPGVVFWRARGRRGEQVGRATSFTWEFGVRHRDSETDTAFGSIYDFNGDGYDDFVVRARLVDPEGDDFLVYWGGSSGPDPERFQRIRVPSGAILPGSGDFNGDGLADLYANVYGTDVLIRGRCRVYESAHGVIGSGFRDTPCGPSGQAIGDYNGDGYSDVVNLQISPNPKPLLYTRSFQVSYGGPSGHGSGGRSEIGDPAGPRRPNLTTVFTSPGDVNGDGYADVILADNSVYGRNGRAWIYWGSASGVRESDPQEIRSAVFDEGVEFGAYVMAAGDLNLDRRADFVVAEGNRAVMRLFLGAERSAVLVASIQRPDPIQPPISGEPPEDLFWGTLGTLGAGLFFDGLPSLVATCGRCVDNADAGVRSGIGRAYVFRWRSSVEIASVLRSDNGEGRVFGASTTPARDVNGDGYDDIIVGDVGVQPGDGVVRVVAGGSAGPMWPGRLSIPSPPSQSSAPYHAFGVNLS